MSTVRGNLYELTVSGESCSHRDGPHPRGKSDGSESTQAKKKMDAGLTSLSPSNSVGSRPDGLPSRHLETRREGREDRVPFSKQPGCEAAGLPLP